ncbi:MAG: NAD-dependent epimerase/dehydratase family protein [Acidobacteriota bacterium]
MAPAAVVTGATGFIGWHLCSCLQRAGWRVKALVRTGSPKPLPGGVERVPAVLERTRLVETFRDADTVFHLAGVTRARNRGGYEAVNVRTAAQVGLAARDTGARLVLVSSLAAAGPGTARRPRREEDPEAPVSDYGVSKLRGEGQVRRIDGLRWTIARPCAVFGPRDGGFRPLFRMASRGLFPLPAAPATAYSLIYVDDLARGLELLGKADEALYEVFFLAHEEPTTLDAFMRCLAQVLGRPYRPIRLPRAALRLATELSGLAHLVGRTPVLTRSRYRELTAGSFVCSTRKAESCLRFKALVPPAEGIRMAAAWYARGEGVRS